ncbi:hypothetical protein ADILRU_2290 [Leifsonia rubra CMS 76R]|nr:hypothetical protein ADILRU_2290 [Leifsonia rubra CMS 76R]
MLTVLARTTRALTGRQIAELTHRGSQSGVRLTLMRLEEQGVVLAESAGRSMLYRANRDHLLWGAVEPLLRAAESALQSLQEQIIDVVSSSLDPQVLGETSVALFGSVARGTSTVLSDIDLVVVFPDTIEEELGQAAINLVTEGVFRWTGNQCNVFVAKREPLRHMVSQGDPMIESWARDAITFNGPDLGERLLSLS